MNVSPTNGGGIEVNGSAPLSSYPAFYTASSSTWATVEAVPSSGYDFAGWSGDLAGITNPSFILVDCAKEITANFTLQTGQEPTGAIEGFVWEDTDGDGIRNSGEPGINDMMVDLYDSSDNLVQSITTQDGSYAFDGLEPAEYYIFFDAPSPYLFSPMGQGENDDTDSDTNANGRTADVIIIIGDTLTLDAGMFLYVSSHVDVTEQEANDIIETNPNLIIVDVREESAFCGEGGHIDGAFNYPWDSGIFEQRYTELPADEDILLVCTEAHLSRHAAEFLDSKGYTSVFNLLGGMNAWESETVGCDSGGGDSGGGDSGGGDSDGGDSSGGDSGEGGGGSGGGCFITTAAEI